VRQRDFRVLQTGKYPAPRVFVTSSISQPGPNVDRLADYARRNHQYAGAVAVLTGPSFPTCLPADMIYGLFLSLLVQVHPVYLGEVAHVAVSWLEFSRV